MDREIYAFDSEETQLEIINKDLFEDLLVWSTDWTIGTIFNLIKKEKIDLSPKMQRRDVWNAPKKSKLIESILLNVPIPQIILAEKSGNKGQYMVIDGKQRLLSITQFLNSLDDNKDPNFTELKLKNLEVLWNLNNLTAQDIMLKEDLADYIDIFENQTMRTIIIKNWKDESVLFTVFNRLNTGTEPLSAQELRMTLNPGPFMDFVNNSELGELQQILGITGLDPRMKDVELIIRYYAFRFFLHEYDGKLRKFFDLTSKTLNELWEAQQKELSSELKNLQTAINLVFEIFDEDAFRKYVDGSYSRQFNKVTFDLLTYFLADERMQDILKNEGSKKLFRETYESFFEDPKIAADFESHTTDYEKVSYRFKKFGALLEGNFSVSFKLQFKESE
ncbi:DUF262 domain-containing protein [Bacillus cereus]|uniref:DUF262 domain-containing protein n=1 Tax=Bacillus cereus TaxID=1396 RepID=UPI00294E4279|nr:DUF262 domain-containing protein [Bacillus cereus]MDV6367443.1 DUF262 domain-containing protein [Bacillus cereus]